MFAAIRLPHHPYRSDTISTSRRAKSLYMVSVWVVTTAFVVATFITVKLRGYKEMPHAIAGRHCRKCDFWRAYSPARPFLTGYLRLS
jgi:hypothetical protein